MLETNRNLLLHYILYLEVTFRNYTFFKGQGLLNRDNIRFDTKIVCQNVWTCFFGDNDDSLSFSNTFQKKSADTLPSLPFLILHAFYTLEAKKCNHQFQSSLFFAKISKTCTSVQNVHDVIIEKGKKINGRV